MFSDVESYAINPMSQDDPRITRVGRFLRKTSLDELPQLFNVIKGEMSLVGPRPEMPFIVATYNEIQRERLKILPGITGLWQLSGDRKKAIHENMDYDIYYIENMSFFLDVAILIETLIFAFRGI
jgi:lipopolysaccharide/colanic/teichoic acid biosynthesis glycosyltransferase